PSVPRVVDKEDDEIVSSLKAAGASFVEMVDFDISKPRSHRKFVRGVMELIGEQAGDLDVVVDAAGVLGSNEIYEKDPVAAAQSVLTNFGGHVSVGLALAEVLRSQGHGTLVVLSSVAGVRVRKANYVYGAAKAGLDGFAQGLGDALSGTGVSVMVVRPGFVRTKMTTDVPEAPFAVGPEEVASAVVDGLRSGKELVHVPAKLRTAFAVMRLLPRPVWRRMPR
ncbi:MAG TPA: SDR family NAD(P)-dependent oxidoreductase, partial [Actinopolymorphaceae bacterium]